MKVREIRHRLDSTLGVELSAGTISKITDAVPDAVLAWQAHPLEAFYGWHEMKPYFLWISCAVSDAVGACRSGSPRRKPPS